MHRFAVLGVLLAACATPGTEDLSGDDGKADGWDSSGSAKREKAVAAKFAAVLGDDAALRQLVAGLPKGADLHMHLSGAASTESLIRVGAADNDCVSTSYLAQACSVGGSPI